MNTQPTDYSADNEPRASASGASAARCSYRTAGCAGPARSHSRLVVGVLACLALAGCNFAPKYEQPAAPIPTTLPTGGAYAPATQPAADPQEIAWNEFFTDEKLRRLIALSLENNRDLRLAALNVERARELFGVQRAEQYPSLSASAAASRRRIPGDLSSSGRRYIAKEYSVDLGVIAWELDFFGRLRNLERAALQQYLATEQARRSAQILLVSSVANAYLTLAADRENLQIARTTLEAQQGSFDIIRQRFERGLSPELDVHRARTQVDTARVDVAGFTRLAAQDLNALNLLAGVTVDEALLPNGLDDVIAPPEIAAGTSSELLLRRPDVLAAENQLLAAYANIGAARAAFFPRISLTGTVGTASNELSGLFGSGSGTWSFAPQASMPIFDARVWAARRVTEADRRIAVARYEQTIQQSFREAADVLAVRGTVHEQVAAQQSLVDSVRRTYELSQNRYDRGIDSYLSVLDAQRSLYGAQQGMVALRLADLTSRVNVYAVLGGGWTAP